MDETKGKNLENTKPGSSQGTGKNNPDNETTSRRSFLKLGVAGAGVAAAGAAGVTVSRNSLHHSGDSSHGDREELLKAQILRLPELGQSGYTPANFETDLS